MLSFDVLVIGSGGAGMRAALAAAQTGDLNVALMTKVFPTRSATGMAQGGINGVMRHADPGDTLEKHIFDTVKGSDFLGDQDAIEFFCQNMPAVINELDYLGVPFSRDAQGRIAQRNFGLTVFNLSVFGSQSTTKSRISGKLFRGEISNRSPNLPSTSSSAASQASMA